MGLLNWMATKAPEGDKKDYFTAVRNSADKGKHDDFNARMEAEIAAKTAAAQQTQSGWTSFWGGGDGGGELGLWISDGE